MFTSAISELAAALRSGDNVDAAVEDIACEYGLNSTDLRVSALAVLGELEPYAERHKAIAGTGGSMWSQPVGHCTLGQTPG